jgi:HK97 family phage portal protein
MALAARPVIQRKDVAVMPRELFWEEGLPFDPDLALTGFGESGRRAYAVAALAYICIRYRATKLREAPLMVVEEGEAGEVWQKSHALGSLLARPNPDYGMARMIEATETYLCTTGRCLWLKNRDAAGRVASLYPFGGDEFTVESSRDRLYARFRINSRPDRDFAPDDVIFFSFFDPANPLGGVAPLDAAMGSLGIAQSLQIRVRAYLKNAMAPGGVYVADKEWKPTRDEFEELKQQIGTLFQGVNSGRPAVAAGGGKFEKGWSLADLALGELWREAEAIVCACFGVPASLVGTIVGLENSPWSHLATAKRSFYDETVIPEWTYLSDTLTDALLREQDPNPAHLIRFDTSRITALQRDLAAQATIAAAAARFTSVNERRAMMGLAPVDDEGADDVPELAAPVVPPASPAGGDGTGTGDPADAGAKARRAPTVSARFLVTDAMLEQHAAVWELAAAAQLGADRERLAHLVERAGQAKEAVPRRTQERILTALEAYLDDEAEGHWRAATRPLIQQTADAAMYASVVPDTGVAYRLLRPHLGSYVEREAAFLITSVTDTTKQAVRGALKEAFDAGEGVAAAARRIREATAFSRDRAKLIARTETTRVFNGAPMEALAQYGQTTGSKFLKVWNATLDDRTRDEHAAMHDEAVAIDQPFSNGLMAPGEPNCRCMLTYANAPE